MKDRFHPPVRIEWGRTGTIRAITSIDEVAELLVSDAWPERGEAYQQACRTVVAFDDGAVTAGEVRADYEAAAQEAGILMPALNA